MMKSMHKLNTLDATSIENKFSAFSETMFDNTDEAEQWLKAVSAYCDELEEVMEKHEIAQQLDVTNEEARAAADRDYEQIRPLMNKWLYILDQKFLHEAPASFKDSRLLQSKSEKGKLYHEDNQRLEAQEERLVDQYYEITAPLTGWIEGEEKNITELTALLVEEDRSVRKQAFECLTQVLVSVKDPLQDIMDKLVKIRHQQALNTGFDDYRTYRFRVLERWDYKPQDCIKLASVIQEAVLPLAAKLHRRKQEALNVDKLYPYDIKAPLQGTLAPFQTTDEWLNKTEAVLFHIDSDFGDLFVNMRRNGMLDLTNRTNKAPGGFCAALPASKQSFIFMNSTGTHRDMETLFHEMGHCIHNEAKFRYKINFSRNTPKEINELASMAMELISMEQWDKFYSEESICKQAKISHLEQAVLFLAEGMKIDLFQHWLYENPHHRSEERLTAFASISDSLNPDNVNNSAYPDYQKLGWQLVMHIFEEPFYYVEYVMAQLGALQLYRNYRQDPERTILRYKTMLSLGNTKSIPELYQAAGISFDFSEEIVSELMQFAEEEIARLGG